MTRSTAISLGDHFAQFVDQQVDGGRYGSASDVVRAGLRLLEEQEAKRDALRSALDHGEASGGFEEFDLDGFMSLERVSCTSLPSGEG